MKINTFKKVAVSTMALAMGAALVGSISGSIAWYQYSTRSTLSYSGASAHCTESLQVRVYQNEIPAVPAEAHVSTDPAIDPLKTYYTASASVSEGRLDDGTNKYSPVDPGDLDADELAAGHYYEIDVEGSDAVAAVGDNTWRSDLRVSDIRAYLTAAGRSDFNLRPVSSGELAANEFASNLIKEPIYQYGGLGSWSQASANDYVDLPLQFRVVDITGVVVAGEYQDFLAKDLYLSDLQLNSVTVAGKKDISNALRVSFDGTGAFDRTYSKLGEDVDAYGKLDLGGDTGLDINEAYDYYSVRRSGDDAAMAALEPETLEVGDVFDNTSDNSLYVWDGSDWVVKADGYVVYGNDGEVAESVEVSDANLADDSDPYNIVAHGAKLGTTNADGTALKVTVRIYLEGWQPLEVGAGPETSAVWSDKDYVESKFQVNMRFSVDAHTTH